MKRSVRAGWIVLALGCVIALILAVAPAPYVIEEPGPVFNTLGTGAQIGADPTSPSVTKKPLISIPGKKTYKTSGELDMLTVSSLGNRESHPSWFQIIAAWADPRKALLPLDLVYPPSQTTKQVNAEEMAQMTNSQQDAIAAALNSLGYNFSQSIVVKSLLKGYPASEVLKTNDKIVSVNGQAVSGIGSLRKAIAKNGTGMVATIGILRNGLAKTVSVMPKKDQGATVVGIGVSMKYTFPFEVNIQLNNVGGPSAGMMFALGIIDKLTPGHLNGGEDVAGTGTIDSEGNVGVIGGIRQKMYGARDAGARWFLAPAGNCDDVTGHIPNGLRVFAVKKLGDSLNVLKAIASGGSTKKLPTCATG